MHTVTPLLAVPPTFGLPHRRSMTYPQGKESIPYRENKHTQGINRNILQKERHMEMRCR